MSTLTAVAGHTVDDEVDVHGLSEELRRGAADIAAAEYRWLRLLAAFDAAGGWGAEGARNCAHWLSWACGIGPEAARERVRVARALDDLPEVCAAFASGELSYSKVRAITRIACAANESLLVSYGLSSTAAHLEQVVALHRRHERDVEAGGPGDPQVAYERRSLDWRVRADGTTRITIDLPAEEAAAHIAVIEAMADDLGEPAPPPAVEALPGRKGCVAAAESGAVEAPVVSPRWDVPAPRAVRRADAFVRLLETAAGQQPAAVTDRARVVIHVPVADALADHTDDGAVPEVGQRTGITSDGAESVGEGDDPRPGQAERTPGSVAGPHLVIPGTDRRVALAPSTARRLCCDASMTAMVIDALGNPLGVGRRTRQISDRLRRALVARDGGCRFPSCPATRFVDAHHVVWWSRGGHTDLDNLVLLCRHHHRLVHDAGYDVRAHGDQRFTFHRPDGTHIPEATRSPQGDPDRLVAVNRAAGVDPHKDTLVPDWDGTPPDRTMTAQALWQATTGSVDMPRPRSRLNLGTPAASGAEHSSGPDTTDDQDVSAVPPASTSGTSSAVEDTDLQPSQWTDLDIDVSAVPPHRLN